MIEDQFLSVDLTVDRPVATLHAVSHDPTLRELVTLRSGRTLTAVQLQMEYAEQARKYVEDRFGSDADPVTVDVLDRWESVLTRLESDPMSLSRELDWVAKLQILEGYRRPRRARLGVAAAGGGRPAVLRRAAGQGPLQQAGGRRAASTGSSPTPRSSARSSSRRRTPGPTSAAAAWRSTRTRSPPRPGTRSSSTCPGTTRCSGCRRWSRCGARRSTSAACSTAATPPTQLVARPHRRLTPRRPGPATAPPVGVVRNLMGRVPAAD